MIPGVGGSYWTTFFPAVVLLGLGMALVVAPLTTTVMNAVPQHQAGLASGINNAVARLAGLLAIAVFGIVFLNVFSGELGQELRARAVPAGIAQAVEAQRRQLASADAPTGASAEERTAVREAIQASFVTGFRWVMGVGAALALGSAAIALVTVEGKGGEAYPVS
jgi:hypothetical protein